MSQILTIKSGESCRFKDIKNGEVFVYANSFYLKTSRTHGYKFLADRAEYVAETANVNRSELR